MRRLEAYRGRSHPFAVATCRQTVEALTRAAVHRLAADGYEWHVATCRQTVEALLIRPSFNHRTHRTHGNKSSHHYVLLPCIRCVLWFPALRRQERVRVRGSTVSGGRQHCDGLEELEPTHRDDATTAAASYSGLTSIDIQVPVIHLSSPVPLASDRPTINSQEFEQSPSE